MVPSALEQPGLLPLSPTATPSRQPAEGAAEVDRCRRPRKLPFTRPRPLAWVRVPRKPYLVQTKAYDWCMKSQSGSRGRRPSSRLLSYRSRNSPSFQIPRLRDEACPPVAGTSGRPETCHPAKCRVPAIPSKPPSQRSRGRLAARMSAAFDQLSPRRQPACP